MSRILAALGCGHLSDGLHTTDRELIGEQWDPDNLGYNIEDIGDGRKWIYNQTLDVETRSWTWAGETEIYASFRIYQSVRADVGCVSLYDGATHMGAIMINSSGKVIYSKNSSPNEAIGVVATSAGTIPLSTATHVEVRVILHNTTGSVKVWIDGVLDSDTTGIDTIASGTSCTQVTLMFSKYSPNTKWTDFVIHNDSSPLGDLGVYYIPANADGVDTDFTPSAGDNYENVDEIGPDEDTTYNESDGTAGHRDSFENAGISGIAPIAVAALVRARKTGGSAATILPGIVHSGSETQGAARTLSESYLTFEEFMDDVPGDSGWTLTQIGNAEVSYEVGA